MRTFGAAGAIVLPDFRKVAGSHVAAFLNAKDHVFHLLKSRQNAESGRFREELLRNFLRQVLPGALAVDTGFIYGFEQVPTSDQLDIIVWHKALHSPVFDAGSAVIVPPEAVIAVVSVKSKMTLGEVESGLKNLMSIAPLDYTFRSNLLVPGTDKPLPAIAKFLVFYSQPDSVGGVLERAGSVVSDAIRADIRIARPFVNAMKECDPFNGRHPSWEEARRALPRFIATIEPGDANYVQGWGPPDEAVGPTFGPGLKRLPWIYRSDSKVTSSLEKLVYLLLGAAHRTLQSPGLSTLSSWGDLDPATGMRIGSVEESVEDEGNSLLDVDALTDGESDRQGEGGDDTHPQDD